jgi:hypothetical protein
VRGAPPASASTLARIRDGARGLRVARASSARRRRSRSRWIISRTDDFPLLPSAAGRRLSRSPPATAPRPAPASVVAALGAKKRDAAAPLEKAKRRMRSSTSEEPQSVDGIEALRVDGVIVGGVVGGVRRALRHRPNRFGSRAAPAANLSTNSSRTCRSPGRFYRRRAGASSGGLRRHGRRAGRRVQHRVLCSDPRQRDAIGAREPSVDFLDRRRHRVVLERAAATSRRGSSHRAMRSAWRR